MPSDKIQDCEDIICGCKSKPQFPVTGMDKGILSDGGDGRFDHAPYFNFNDDKVKFDTKHVSNANDNYGTASGLVPKSLP